MTTTMPSSLRDRAGGHAPADHRDRRGRRASSPTRSSRTAATRRRSISPCSTGSPTGRTASSIDVTAITPTKAGEGKTTTSVSLDAGPRAHRQAGRALPPRGLARPRVRDQGRRRRRRLRAGRADGGHEPPLHRRHPRDRRREQPARRDARGAPAARQRARASTRSRSAGAAASTSTTARCATSSIGLGGRANGYPRQTGFDITAASEVMAIVAVASDLQDLRARLGAITVGSTYDGEPVTAEQLRAAGSMAVLLKETIKPNLVQTLEGQPAFVHCGPFANIAHGNNSVVADRVALKLARLRRDRERLRLRHGHGEVLRHRLPARRPAPGRRRARRDGQGAEAPRRRPGRRRRCDRDRRRRTSPGTSGSCASSA